MANLLDWLGGVGAQINPFDNGETYDSYMKKRQQAQTQRPQTPSVAPRPQQVGGASVRPLTPQASPVPRINQAQISQRSVANQFNPLKAVGDGIAQISKPISQGGINAFADAGNFLKDTVVKGAADTATNVVRDPIGAAKGVVSGIQQAPAAIADIGLQGQAVAGSIADNLNPTLNGQQRDMRNMQRVQQTENLRNWLKNQKTITGDPLVRKDDWKPTGNFLQDAADLAGRSLNVANSATMFANPTRLAAGAGARLTVPQTAKFIARDAGFFGGTGGLQQGLDTYGQTGDVRQALTQGGQAAVNSALMQGALDTGGLALNKGINRVQDARYAEKAQRLREAADSQQTVTIPTSRLISYEGAPDRARVKQYKQAIASGQPIEPLIIMKDDRNKFGVEDGKHRLQAYQELGIKNVPAKVVTPAGIKRIAERGSLQFFRDQPSLEPSRAFPSDAGQGNAPKGTNTPGSNAKSAEFGGSGEMPNAINGRQISSENSVAQVAPVKTRPVEKLLAQAYSAEPPAKSPSRTLTDSNGNGAIQNNGGEIGSPIIQKRTRYADKTIPESQFVGEQVSAQTKENAPMYTPQTERGRYEQTLRSANQKGFDNFENDVHERLQNDHVDAQTIADSQAVAQRLEAKGDSASLRRASEIYDKVSEHLTKAGQTVQAAAIMSRRTPDGMRYQAINDLRKAGVKLEANQQLIKRINQATEAIRKTQPATEARKKAIGELAKEVEQSIPNGAISNLVSVWKAGLLSGVKTTQGNIISNATFGALGRLSNPVALIADNAMAAITGKRTVTGTLRGITKGTREGLDKGLYTLKTGIDLRDVTDKYESHRGINFENKTLQKLLGNPAQKVFDFMGAQDQPFYFAQLKNSLYDLAKADGINKGLTGKALRDYMDRIAQNPPQKLLQIATDDAAKAVLGYDTVAFKAIQGAKRGIDQMKAPEKVKQMGHAVVDVLAPFTRVPTAFLSRSIDYTPLGVPKEVFNQIANGTFDQRALSKAIGEGVTGTGLIVLGAALTNSGQVSGDYPTDQKEIQRWKAQGIQPNSVKLGNTWVSLNYLGPIGMLMGAGKKFMDSSNKGEGAISSTAAAIGGFGQTLLGQSFLQGLSGFMDAAQDPERYLKSFVNSQSGSIIPALVNDFANLTDGFQRQVDNGWEAILNRIPGARQSLEKKQDVYGNKLDQNPLSTLVGVKPTAERHGTVLDEVSRLANVDKNNQDLQVTPTTIDKSVKVEGKPIQLSDTQRYELQETVGKATQDAWKSMIESNEYKQLTDTEKAKALTSLKQDVAAVAQRQYIESNGLAQYTSPLSGRQKNILNGTSSLSSYARSGDAGDSINISKSIASEYETTLSKYNSLSDDDRKNWFNTENDAEYKYNLAKFENDKANGTLSKAQTITKQRTLYKDKIGSNYSKDVRDLYNVNENDLAQWLSEDDGKTDKQKLADDLYAYDRALYDAGVIKSMKYKGGIAAKGGKGGRKGNGTAQGKALVSLASQLNKIRAPKTSTGAAMPSGNLKFKGANKVSLKKYTVQKTGSTKSPRIRVSKA